MVIPHNKLNLKNTLIKKKDLIDVFLKAGIKTKPKNLSIYIQSFVHKSYTQDTKNPMINFNLNCIQLQEESQEKMEFVGDSILSFVVCNYLYNKFNLNEGKLTKLKQRVVDSKTLASFARFYNFDKWCLISSYMESTTGRLQDKLMEDTFEAFVYAVYFDLGIHVAEKFIINTIELLLDFSVLLNVDINYKHQLLELFQKFWNLTPEYVKTSEIGLPFKKTYTVEVRDPFGNTLGIGVASLKKDAEQIASLNSIPVFKELIKSSNCLTNLKGEIEITEFTNIFNSLELGGVSRELLSIIEHSVSNINYFIIKLTSNGKIFNYKIKFTVDNYKSIKKILNNNEKTLNYLLSFNLNAVGVN